VDSITQALIGAAAGQAVAGHRLGRRAAWIGAAAGTLPDLDVLIRSTSDPLLAIEMHRGFSHALAFVPFGAALVAAPFLLLARSARAEARAVYLAALAGVATHGPLDTFTSYGTQLFWPFTDARLALPAVSIVDPVFTLALAIGVAWATVSRLRAPAVLALSFCMAFLGVGLVQNARATAIQEELARGRGHTVERGRVDPTFANLLLWRSVYRAGDGRLHADAIRIPLLGPATVREGTSVVALREGDLAAVAPGDPRIAGAARVWTWFADGFVTHGPDPGTFADARYASDPAGFDPLWSLVLRPGAPDPVARTSPARRGLAFEQFWVELRGLDPRHLALPAAVAERSPVPRGPGS
jgi:inner membrane protein